MIPLRKYKLVKQMVFRNGMTKPLPQVQFAPGELVTPPQELPVTSLGGFLRVPPNMCGLVRHPSGRLRIYGEGDHLLDLPAGSTFVQFVDMRQFNTMLPIIRATSSDAWASELQLSISYKVNRPEIVARLEKPVSVLISACVAAAKDFVQSSLHDGLVSAPGAKLIEQEKVSQAIISRLEISHACPGISVLNIFVIDRQGDRRRTEVIQRSIVEQTEINQDKELQRAKADLDAENIIHEIGLSEYERKLSLKKAETELIETEERAKVRLKLAEISSNEARIQKEMRSQEIELQNEAQAQIIQKEIMLKNLEIRGQVVGQVAAALLQSQATIGLQRGMDENSRNVLVGVLNGFSNINPEAQVPFAGHSLSAGSRNETLRERLASELGHVIEMPGARCDPLQELGNGEIEVDVFYLDWKVKIICGPDYPAAPPKSVVANLIEEPPFKPIVLNWDTPLRLEKIVQVAVAQFVATTPYSAS